MSAPILELRGLGKSYREYPSQLRRFASWFGAGGGGFQEHWVLRKVSLAIHGGEAIGVVGRNGAGKSTLLKIIAGTLAATEGAVVSRGRISAILELGMGFNSEQTGRQNVLHACGLMGFARSEILAAMAGIGEFAELGDYFEQPVRTYSSGMQMRLAFSVATAFRPELLIVDEALSVGDAYFQHKSFERIRQFQAQGTTLLLVSHDRAAILALCDRVLLLDRGCVLKDGKPDEVMDYYNALLAERGDNTIRQQAAGERRKQTISGSGEVGFEEILLLDAEGKPVDLVEVGARITLRLVVAVQQPLPELVIGYMVKDRLGQIVYGTNTAHREQIVTGLTPGQRLVYDFTFAANLGVGSYSVTIAAHQGRSHLQANYEWRDLALIFNVANCSHAEFIGCGWLEPEISIGSHRG